MTLLELRNDHDIDTGVQRYEACFGTGDGPISIPLTREQFLSYVGKVGTEYAADMKAVA